MKMVRAHRRGQGICIEHDVFQLILGADTLFERCEQEIRERGITPEKLNCRDGCAKRFTLFLLVHRQSRGILVGIHSEHCCCEDHRCAAPHSPRRITVANNGGNEGIPNNLVRNRGQRSIEDGEPQYVERVDSCSDLHTGRKKEDCGEEKNKVKAR